jgi:hypothetical protein
MNNYGETIDLNRNIKLESKITLDQKIMVEMIDIYNLAVKYNCLVTIEKNILTSNQNIKKKYLITFNGTHENIKRLSPIVIKTYIEFIKFLNEIDKIT